MYVCVLIISLVPSQWFTLLHWRSRQCSREWQHCSEDWRSSPKTKKTGRLMSSVSDSGKRHRNRGEKKTGTSFCHRRGNVQVTEKLVSTSEAGRQDIRRAHSSDGEAFQPTAFETLQRYKFHTRLRKETESVSIYISELRSLAEHCNFGTTLDLMLRDRLVCGVNDDAIQRRLLAERNLTFEKALATAQSLEAAAQNMKELHQESQQDEVEQGEVRKVRVSTPHESVSTSEKEKSETKDQRGGRGGSQFTCYRCGKTGHSPRQCRHKEAKCFECGKIGHLRSVCRSKTTRGDRDRKPDPVVRHLQAGADEEYSLFNLSCKQQKPLEITVSMEGKQLVMEVDTGASLSLMSESTCKQLWPNKRIPPANVNLRTYSGERVGVLGRLEVNVVYQDQRATVPILIVKGEGPTLLGRDWLTVFKLDWQSVNHISNKPIDKLLGKYQNLFDGELGTLKGYKAKLHVDPKEKPIFKKAHPIPYAMREKVEKEIDRLVQEGTLKPVEYADWATPIVPVIKKDGNSVRVCGDFKQTINKVAQLDRYPIPRIEDLLAKLAGGKQFSKLDLSQAYQQVPLEESSQQYV